MGSISPQGYNYGEAPKSVHPFWDDSTYITDLTASASVDNTTGTPSVDLDVTEQDGVANLDFQFHGLKGEQGIQGIQGPQGIQGERGPQGIQGETGPQGIQGETGPQGIQGERGPQGIQGETGPQGIQGETGPQGIQGETGPQGPAGNNGAFWWNTIEDYTTPNYTFNILDLSGMTGRAPVVGDLISQNVNHRTFVFRINTVDTTTVLTDYLFELTGATGPQGIQGETGPQGIQGIQGETGPQGIQGERGPQGIQGETGPQGIQGETGPQGIQGIQGETGPQGIQGETGPQGPAGLDGAMYWVATRDVSSGCSFSDLSSATGARDPAPDDFILQLYNNTTSLYAIVAVSGTSVTTFFIADLTGATGAAGPGVPSGGTAGQVLQKASGTDYDTEWASPSGLPSGGSAGQILRKNSATAGDASWAFQNVYEAYPGASTSPNTAETIATIVTTMQDEKFDELFIKFANNDFTSGRMHLYKTSNNALHFTKDGNFNAIQTYSLVTTGSGIYYRDIINQFSGIRLYNSGGIGDTGFAADVITQSTNKVWDETDAPDFTDGAAPFLLLTLGGVDYKIPVRLSARILEGPATRADATETYRIYLIAEILSYSDGSNRYDVANTMTDGRLVFVIDSVRRAMMTVKRY